MFAPVTLACLFLVIFGSCCCCGRHKLTQVVPIQDEDECKRNFEFRSGDDIGIWFFNQRVTKVRAGSTADKFGIRQGDKIVSINGEIVHEDVQIRKQLIRAQRIDVRFHIQFLREYGDLKIRDSDGLDTHRTLTSSLDFGNLKSRPHPNSRNSNPNLDLTVTLT